MRQFGDQLVSSFLNLSGTVFIITVLATFIATFLARLHSRRYESDAPPDQQLSKWLVGLSAGATANSGFIVTAAVGLGYNFGLQWLLLPLGWLIGDIVFWLFFPARINEFGARTRSVTLSDIVTHGTRGPLRKFVGLLVGLILVLGLTGYTSAQWLAGQKFLSGAFGVTPIVSLSMFAAIIILYTSIGGFRGSIYADSFQAVLRVFGTMVALGGVVFVASRDWTSFTTNLESAGPSFLDLFSMGSPLFVISFMAGFAFASLGFGLGQPQIITRYLAGRSPSETKAAWWIYILFVQFTWIAMTLFGVFLRGVMPSLDDPEAGLSVFFQSNFNQIISGVIIADIFATIAATSNSLLVAMAQSVRRDILEGLLGKRLVPLWMATIAIGLMTMIVSLYANSTVVNLALTSVSLVGAGLAPVVMAQVLGWRVSAISITAAILIGTGAAVAWRLSPYAAQLNEAAIGITVGVIVNWVLARLSPAAVSR